MLRAARAEPTRLAIGIDADAASMRSSATRISRRRTYAANAIFVVSAVEQLPEDLAGVADRVTITFPWGSLLRGLITGADAILGPLARVTSARADVTVMWSILPHDVAAVGVPPLLDEVLVERFDRHGLAVKEIRPASIEEIRATGSSWAKRLGAGSSRPVTRLLATRR